jgi:hypothetical protein
MLCLHEKSHSYAVERDHFLAGHDQQLPHTNSHVFCSRQTHRNCGLVANIVVLQAHRCMASLRPWNSSKTRTLHHSKKRCRSLWLWRGRTLLDTGKSEENALE